MTILKFVVAHCQQAIARGLGVTLAAALLLSPVAAAAQTQPAQPQPAKTVITLSVGGAQTLKSDRPFDKLVNPNPTVATIEIPDRRTLVLFGAQEGVTELSLMDAKGVEFQRFQVVVEQNVDSLQRLLVEVVGEPAIKVRRVGSSIVLTGEVDNPGRVALAGDIARKASGVGDGVVNLLQSIGQDQVTLSVKVLEVKKSEIKSLGLKWAARNARTGIGANQIGNIFNSGTILRPTDQFSFAAASTWRAGSGVIDAFVDFLRTEGHAKLLAAPTIVATSGKPSKFLSGGEFPVPMPYNNFLGNQTTADGRASTFVGLDYRPFGVSLTSTATITADGRIDLLVAPEVSSIDYGNSIDYGGNRVPAMATRRAETSLRIASGDSVVFAGLTSRASDSQKNRLPGKMKFLDFLAGSSSESEAETELLIIVTPVIGGPVASGQAAKGAEGGSNEPH